MGLATARAFARAGASTVLVDIDETAVQSAAEDLSGEGREVLALVADVNDETQVAPPSPPPSIRTAGSMQRSTTPAS